MSEEKLVSAKEAIEAVLAGRLADDPSFMKELATDPDSVIKPLIAEVLGDDGEIDMSSLTTVVNVDTPNRLHFSVPVPEAEVAGFGSFDLGLNLRQVSVSSRGPVVRGSKLDSHSGVCVCPSEDCETQVYCDLVKQ